MNRKRVALRLGASEARERVPGKRGLRWLLLVSASLSAIALFLLATATANTALFAQGYDNLLILNGVLVGVADAGRRLAAVAIAPQLEGGGVRLAAGRAPGACCSRWWPCCPGALVYAVSVQFIGRSIESWFDVRVDRALEGGSNLGRNALDYLLKETANKASQMAVTLAESPGNLAGDVEPRGGTGQRVRGGAVLADRQRARGRRDGRLADNARAAARGGAAPGTTAAAVFQDRAGAGRRPGVARRGAGEHRRQPESAQAAAGHRAGAEAARAGCRTRAGRHARLPGALVFAQRVEAAVCIDADADAAARA